MIPKEIENAKTKQRQHPFQRNVRRAEQSRRADQGYDGKENNWTLCQRSIVRDSNVLQAKELRNLRP